MRRTLTFVIGLLILATTAPPAANALIRVPLGTRNPAGVERQAILSSTGTIDLRGPLICPAGASAHIEITLTQPATGAVAEGEWSGICTGAGPPGPSAPQVWHATAVPTTAVAFTPGTGRRALTFVGVVSFENVSDDWRAEPINLRSA